LYLMRGMRALLSLIMPNLGRLPAPPQVLREVVPVNDHYMENRLFFISLITLVVLAATLLWANAHRQGSAVYLPDELSNLATQLSVTAEEMTMLQEMGLLRESPRMSTLKEHNMAVFLTGQMRKVQHNCFVLSEKHITFRLIKMPATAWSVQWQPKK